jgi:hypothetical protein
MKPLIIFAVTIAMMLAAAPAEAATDWGADAFSAPKHSIAEAEQSMGARFESYSIYSTLDRPEVLESGKTMRAMRKHALVYLNINSLIIGRLGHKVPICWTAIAAGRRDGQLEAWAQHILATNYHHFLITFNHEPMWSSPSQPKCSDLYDNPTTYKQAYNHVRNLFIADGIEAPWAYVMTPGATHWAGGLQYRPALTAFQVIGTDQYYRCDDTRYAPADAFTSFFAWTPKYAPDKPVLVGEIGALSTCPVRSLRWLQNAKTRLLAHDVLAINWNLRTDPGKEYNPLLHPDIAAWWLAWAADETGLVRPRG